MPLGPDPSRAAAVLVGLDGLRADVTAAEDDVLACLVVTGEPRPQRVLDDWLDQVADTLRAVGEVTADLAPALGRYAGSAHAPAAAGRSVGGVAADEGPPLEQPARSVGRVAAAEETPPEGLGPIRAGHPGRARQSIPAGRPDRAGHHDPRDPT